MQTPRVGLVGLGFGAEFIPIYQAHPHAEVAAICRRTESKLHEVGERFGIPTRYTRYEDMLEDPGEMKNIAYNKEHNETLQQHRSYLAEYCRKYNDDFPFPSRDEA